VRHKRHDIETLQKKRFTEYKRQKKQSLQKITEEKIYKRRKKHKRETFLNLQKRKRKQIFTKDKKQHKFFLHKRESEADYKRGTEKRNAKRKDRRTRRESP
jgi:hypothetical protein